MFADALRQTASFCRANLVWITFAVGIGVQGAALRLATQRSKLPTVGVIDECDIVASSAPVAHLAAPIELPELTEPLTGAEVPTSLDRLPGAARAYRGGEHEGIDFRSQPGEPVHAAADGWVLSIEDEPNLPETRRDELLRTCRQLGETPPEVLRVLHGRRITLRHESGPGHLVTTSYSHLGTIRPDLKPGARVHEREIIGTAGASGTSHAYLQAPWAEVHFELRIDGQPLGQGLPPAEAGELYRECFGEVR